MAVMAAPDNYPDHSVAIQAIQAIQVTQLRSNVT
jgi:hypothetical protein